MAVSSHPDWDTLLLALITGSHGGVLRNVDRLRSKPVSDYAREWFSLVGRELLADIMESAERVRPMRRDGKKGSGAGELAYNLSYVGASDENPRISFVSVIDASRGAARDDEDVSEGMTSSSSHHAVVVDDDGDDPPLNYQVLFSPERRLCWCLVTPLSGPASGLFRAVALDARGSIADVAGGGRNQAFPRCVSISTSMSALYRAHALSRLHEVRPSILRVLIRGYIPSPAGAAAAGDDDDGGGNAPGGGELWKPCRASGGILRLNEGQRAALEGLEDPMEAVQGPPGTGKSSFITEAFLQRIPKAARVLACTSTNKAIDSLVEKFEAAGVREMVAVGSRARMGEASRRYLLSARLSRDPVVARAESLLASVRLKRELAEERVAAAAKPRNKKKEKGGKENNRGFVKRALEKLKADRKPAKKTPGVVRLMKIIELEAPGPITNAELVSAANAYLSAPPSTEDAAAFEDLARAKGDLKDKERLEAKVEAEAARLRSRASRRVWRAARFVACTASSAVHVTRRLSQDLEAEEEGDEGSSAGSPPIRFEYVILDEAGAMLEPDALGTLVHGARALLLVGDHFQLQPFSKWQAAASNQYNVSLMERLASAAASGGGGGGGRRPPAMLTEQYRMHPDIASVVSGCFYGGRLTTGAPTALARRHPLPAAFLEAGGDESRPEGATSWRNEAEAEVVADLVEAVASHGGHGASSVVVLTFYNGQRALLASLLAARPSLRGVEVVSVDAMQGREADVVVLSCVRTSSRGLGFLADRRRLNVALSRAREQIVVVGARGCLEADRNWRAALQGLRHYDSLHTFKQDYFREVPKGSYASTAPSAPSSAPTGPAAAAAAAAALLPPQKRQQQQQHREGIDTAAEKELAALSKLAGADVHHKEEGDGYADAASEAVGDAVSRLSLEEEGAAGKADAAFGGVAGVTDGALQRDEDVADSWEDAVEEEREEEKTEENNLGAAEGRSLSPAAPAVPEEQEEGEESDWGSSASGEGAPGARRRAPAVRELLSGIEAAVSSALGPPSDLQGALKAAAPGLLKLCEGRRPQQVALLGGVAALLEPGGAEDLPGATLRLLGGSSLVRAAKALYDLDVLEEEAVVQWVEDMKTAARLSEEGGVFTERIKQMAPFVKWLQEADEEASSGSDE